MVSDRDALYRLYYVLCAEGLANLIRKDIRGIPLPNVDCSLKLIQHADDTTIFVTDNDDFNVIEKVFQIYSLGSGSKINIHKSQGLWIGKWKDKPGWFSWGKDLLKIVGIFFGNEDNTKMNWEPRVSKITTVKKMER